MSTTPIEELARVLRESRARRKFERKRVADMAGCSANLVEEWECGKAVPDNSQWARLVNMFDRTLTVHAPLHQRALAQLTEEARERVANRAAEANAPKTNLGTKLMLVTPLMKPTPAAPVREPEPAPEPASPWANDDLDDEDEHPSFKPRHDEDKPVTRIKHDASNVFATFPEGWRKPEAIKERKEWIQAYFTLHPDAPINGAAELCRERFGLSLDRDSIVKIKVAVNAERQRRLPQPPKVVARSAPTNPREAVEAGTQLILEAIPNLATLTITVDGRGAAAVSYTVREVKIVETMIETKGAFTLKGKG